MGFGANFDVAARTQLQQVEKAVRELKTVLGKNAAVTPEVADKIRQMTQAHNDLVQRISKLGRRRGDAIVE